jgi:transcriptional regulator with XRE-family HTH domain
MKWLFLAYRLPRVPSCERSLVYGQLKSLGGLFFQRGLYVLPASDEHRAQLRAVAQQVQALDCDALILDSPETGVADDGSLQMAFCRTTREAYAAVVRACQGQIRDLEGRTADALGARGRCLRAQARMRQLRQWYAVAAAHEWFETGHRETAAGALAAAEAALAGFLARAPARASRAERPVPPPVAHRLPDDVRGFWLNHSQAIQRTWSLPGLRALRATIGLSPRQLSLLAGLKPETVSRLEGGNSRALAGSLVKLAEVLGRDPLELVSPDDAERVAAFRAQPRRFPVPASSLRRDHVALPRLQQVRVQAGLDVETLARLSEIHVTTIVALEAGRESARLMTAVKFARALRVTVADLMDNNLEVSRLRQARYRAGMTASDLSRASGVTRKAIREIERGKRPVKLTTLASLAGSLGTTVEDLLGRAPEPGRKTVRLLPVLGG